MSAWEQYKKNLGETRPWDLIGPNVEWAKKEQSQTRLSTCNECPELIQMTKTCKKCGCFMTAKTKLLKATCPLGKW